MGSSLKILSESRSIRRETYVTICDHWEFLTYMPASLETVFVDVHKGTREYDIMIEMNKAGHLFVHEHEGYIDQIALTPLGFRIKLDQQKEWMDEAKWETLIDGNRDMREQWRRAFRKRQLPWQKFM